MNPDLLQWASAGVLAAIVSYIAYRLRFLDAGGAIASAALGTAIFGIGGWRWAVPVLTFFFSSSILSKVNTRKKSRAAEIYEKSSRRDHVQVLANGGVAGLGVVLFYLTQSESAYLLFLGSLSAVTADTWSTEIGSLASGEPRSITSFREVPIGTSGAITLLGTLAALAAGLLMAVAGYFSHEPQIQYQPEAFLIVSLSGLLGSLIDSVLGATLQSQFRCDRCGSITEKRSHCSGFQTTLWRGRGWVSNDVVNTLAAVAGGVFAAFCHWLFVRPG